MRVIRVRGSAAADGAVIGGIVPDPATRAASLPEYLRRLRVLRALWSSGSSGAGPEQVLPHEHVDHVRPGVGVVPIHSPLRYPGRQQ